MSSSPDLTIECFSSKSGCCSLLRASCWFVGHLGRTGFLDLVRYWCGSSVDILWITHFNNHVNVGTCRNRWFFSNLVFLASWVLSFWNYMEIVPTVALSCWVWNKVKILYMIFILLPWLCVYPILFFPEWWTNWFWFKIRRFDFWQLV